jgi:glucosylceramidase
MGPTFASQNVTASIFLGTMSNESKDSALIKAVLADATAKSYLKGFGLQWGLENHVGDVTPQNLPVWQTEHQAGNNPWESGYKTTAPNDTAYAAKSWGWIKSWITKGVNQYSAWNMVLDKTGKGIDTTRDWAQNALLFVDGGQLTLTPTFHLFRHISQFVDPGAHLVATQGGDALAFKNPDGSIVAFIFTSGAGKKMTVAIGGKKLQFDMPTNGWATINWK